MNKSESIKELACALSELQSEITDVPASSKGHRHDYADLSDMLKVARPLLKKHGLAISQLVGNAEQNVTVESILMHKSGEWISSLISVPVMAGSNQMNALQSIGSSITYGRRYALGALLNYTKGDDDTDGNAQLANHQQQAPKNSYQKPPVVPAQPVNALPPKAAIPGASPELANQAIEFYERNDLLGAVEFWKKIDQLNKDSLKRTLNSDQNAWFANAWKCRPRTQPAAADYVSV